MTLLSNITNSLFGTEIQRQVREALAVRETDELFTYHSQSLWAKERDRFDYDREEVLRLCLEAWRVNPLARRIVGLTSQYVVGGGVSVVCKHKPTAKFIDDFWENRLNRMQIRVTELCDELTRTGNLFILVSTDQSGMSYLRAVPATQIDRIESQSNDVEQPTLIYPKGTVDNPSPPPWESYTENMNPRSEAGTFKPVMLHYAVNRPVGAQWGESDLAPLLRWFSRYSNWLEDRARLNHYRNAFIYVVTGKFNSEAERIKRQKELNARPPSPGSILVCDDSETWEIKSAQLDSEDANTDGLALKKMIASGAGVPLHFLAEPESATRTTAEAAGGPTYRYYEQRQNYFLWMLSDILQVAIERRALVDGKVDPKTSINWKPADISARDNVALSLAGTNVLNTLSKLRDRKMIDDSEFLRLVYRFIGETVDVEEMLTRGEKAGFPEWVDPASFTNPADALAPAGDHAAGKSKEKSPIDLETGEPKQGGNI